MDMLKVHSMEDISSLPRTKWNIQQPATAEGRENPLTSGNGLDLILVPGLGFTEVRVVSDSGSVSCMLCSPHREGFVWAGGR